MEETCSLVYRLHERYMDDDDEEMQDDLFWGNFSISPCKVANEGALSLIVLNHMQISHIGDVSKLANIVSHVYEADLAWNAITDWKTVGVILAHMPLLRSLNLSHNPLKQDEMDVDLPHMANLQMLILNGTHLKFPLLKKLLDRMPRLTELHLSENEISVDDSTDVLSSSVRLLHLNRCNLSKWSEVSSILSRFPQRTTVFLYENPIESVRYEANHDLSSIRSLNISKSNINDWDSIDHLDLLSGLVDLKIVSVPLLDEFSEEERQHLVISRCKGLHIFNGSEITPEQRESSERFFIRFYQDLEDKPSHYKRLIEKHGHIERLAKVDLTPTTSVKIKIICEDTNYNGELTINLNQTIGQFMKSLEKVINLKYVRMRLFHLRNDDELVDECIYHNLKLHTLRIEDNDTMLIKSKIVVTRLRSKMNSTSST